jgi:Ca-activated chloride channel family protein
MARALLKQAGIARGEVILVADSAGDSRTLDAARSLARRRLSRLSARCRHGARRADPGANGAFARTEAGEIRIAKAELSGLEHVAQAGGGRFEVLRAPGEMAHFARDRREGNEPVRPASGMREEVHDGGVWLALLALPFGALLFRRGWLGGLAALALLPALVPQEAHAFDWESLWRRTDQQAAAAFARAKPSDVARILGRLDSDSPWRAMLLYRSGNFAEAAAQFATGDTAVAHYNRGNALALDGDLEGAISAYDAALARNPAMRDAQFNRALLRKALAAQPMEPQDGDQRSSKREQKSASGGRSRGQARERAEPSDASGRRSQMDEFGLPAVAEPNAATARERNRMDRRRRKRLTPKSASVWRACSEVPMTGLADSRAGSPRQSEARGHSASGSQERAGESGRSSAHLRLSQRLASAAEPRFQRGAELEQCHDLYVGGERFRAHERPRAPACHIGISGLRHRRCVRGLVARPSSAGSRRRARAPLVSQIRLHASCASRREPDDSER